MRALVIEDHAMYRDVLSSLLKERFAAVEVRTADTVSAGRKLFHPNELDLVILDIDLPDGDGLELADEFALADPRLRIMAVSGQCDEYTLSRVLNCGVIAFVDKVKEDLKTLEHAIGEVMEWRTYFAMSVHQVKLAQKMDPKSFSKLLTEREIELMRYFGVGLRNEEIGELLNLSDQTVQGHRRNVIRKLGVSGTSELIRFAIRKGFTRVSDILRQSDED